MMRYSAVIVLMVLCTGCMHDKKPETQPPPVAATPPTAKAPERPTASAPAAKKPTKAKPAEAAPAKPTKTPPAKPAASATAKTTPPATAKTTPPKAATATLDLDALETRLKQTKGIGLMTKLSLKNQVDDLLDEFRKHYAGHATPTMMELRRSYDLLMMKVLSLLQDHDQMLASDILSSRERIWALLANANSFAALQAE